MGIGYFYWFGTIYLLILTYQDIKHRMRIDDRKNYFMLGISISLYSHFTRSIWFVLFIIGLWLLFTRFVKRLNVFGEGDVNAFYWIFIGLSIINPFNVIWFLCCLIFLTILYLLFKKYVLRTRKPTPYFIVILFSFILFALIWGGY